MSVKKAFQPVDPDSCKTLVIDHVGKFVPEMSLSIKDILSQFAYVDNVRLADLAAQGYNQQDDDSGSELLAFALYSSL